MKRLTLTPITGLAVTILTLALSERAMGAREVAATPDTSVHYVPPRASWLSDRMPLRPGDLLTIVVDERTASRERVSKVARGDRLMRGAIRADMNASPKNYGLASEMDQASHDQGEANRSGDLTAVLTVRVTAIEANGVARVQGSKKVTVDGRLQEITLAGAVRPQDVRPSRSVLSERVADAVITYKGKKIGPRSGILGGILSLLWP